VGEGGYTPLAKGVLGGFPPQFFENVMHFFCNLVYNLLQNWVLDGFEIDPLTNQIHIHGAIIWGSGSDIYTDCN